jgi:hypothetical protein
MKYDPGSDFHTPEQQRQYEIIGGLRQDWAVRHGLSDMRRADANSKEVHIVGTKGEGRFARAFGLAQPAARGVDPGIDFRIAGFTVDVKTTVGFGLNLIARMEPKADVLVLAETPSLESLEVRLVGWIPRDLFLWCGRYEDLGHGKTWRYMREFLFKLETLL